MLKLTTSSQMRQWRQNAAASSIGFVPTMGALHRGHLSLVERACKENDAVVVSIFVNPTQFDDPADLQRYPRTIDADIALLEQTSCAVVFTPDVHDVYPEPDTRVFDFGGLDKVMEGERRSGHFNGVAQVVSRLLAIVQPTRAYFGEKDFQQLTIVRQLVKDLCIPVAIVGCPIVREADGLAMSSRNTLLSPEQRAAAPLIARTLFEAVDMVCAYSVDELRGFVINKINNSINNPITTITTINETINANAQMQVEYFEVVDARTLQSVRSWDEYGAKYGCIAVRMGAVRLIDNVRLS
jgi:pantoate--beta-alanine ligase